jgi:hypothetical protein
MTGEMTDAEVADQIERADRFIVDFRAMIAATVVDPASPCADYQRRGLRRIADTLDAVPYVTFCNLANLNAAMRGGVLDLIEVRLLAVGAGPTLDYADAASFLAGFETMIEKVRRRPCNEGLICGGARCGKTGRGVVWLAKAGE